MTYKKFYSIMVLVIMLIAGYLSVQLSSAQEIACIPHLTESCENSMENQCSGMSGEEELTGFKLVGSTCIGTVCMGYWLYYCDFSRIPTDSMLCPDSNGYGCGE